MTRRSRRQVLATLSGGLAAVAGCASLTGSSTSDETSPSDTADRSTTTALATATATPMTDSESTGTPTATATPTDTATATPSPTTTPPAIRRTGPPTAGVESFDRLVPQFMQEWELPGGSVAVAKRGRLVFARGYGLANKETDQPFKPGMLARIGSLSKPVTGVATLNLVERGDLALDDRAFDILSDLVPKGGPADPRVEEITVRQLLQHTAGWKGRAQGFNPMFKPVEIAKAQGEDPPASAEAIIRYVLGKQLAHEPGTTFQYSNFGYCVLGRIIESVTGESYESHVQQAVLSKLGATRMEIGATRQSKLRDDEVHYYGHRTAESPFPDVGTVPRPYAAASLRANDADGGWIGSSVDLCRFVMGINGRSEFPDVLDQSTIETMSARPDVDQWSGARQFYGKGWFVRPVGDTHLLWHNGSLPGSYGFLFHSGNTDETVAGLFNSRPPALSFRQFDRAAQKTLLSATKAVEEWPDRDLFGQFE